MKHVWCLGAMLVFLLLVPVTWSPARTAIYFFDPSGNRLETFGGYTAYQMDPDCRAIKWTTDQIGPAVFYYSQELNQSFLSVDT